MIGPTIPEALLKKKAANEDEIMISMSDEEDAEALGPQIPASVLEKKRQNDQDIGPQMPSAQSVAGPQIPQHILEQKAKANKNADEISISFEEEEEDILGPQIPTPATAGPQIPAHILQQRSSKNSNEIVVSEDEEEEKDNSIGPQIPQHILNKKSIAATPIVEEEEEVDPNAFAPELPPDLIEQQRKQQPQPTTGRRRRPVGPSFPTGPMPPQQDDDDYMVGPALPSNYNPDEVAKYSAIHAIEERARQTQEAMEKKNDNTGKVERPEWMLVPPEVDYLKKANSSKSRQFTNKTMSKEELDSSEWTMTPAQKQQRLEEQRSGKRKTMEEEVDFSQLDRERIRNVQEYNMQTRPLTLLEMHQQKKKKNKDYTVEDVTKRAFDREKDLLGGKKMDRKTKKEMLRQSAQLGDKFGYGKSSFL